MRVLILIALLLTSFPALGDEQHSGVRAEYDDLMQSSGKWDFIEHTSIFLGVLAGATSIYSYNREQYFLNLQGKQTLNAHEQSQFNAWQNLCNNTGYGSAGLFGIAIGAGLVGMHYENRAHEFALDMGVKF